MACGTVPQRVAAVMVVVLGLLGTFNAREAAAAPLAAREDYFISGDTVLIGCTAGAAAGVLAGSLPVFAALAAGIGFPASVATLINLTGLGCGVGAASGGVAILTAWLLDRVRTQAPAVPPATAR